MSTDDSSREARIAQLEARLAAKERELQEIQGSRAWRAVSALRSLKHRLVDPVLAVFGIRWPRKSNSSHLSHLSHSSHLSHRPPPPRADRYDVLCLSTCDWHERFQRPQQLLSRFAEAGHRVFWISRHFREDGPPWTLQTVRENVHEVTLRGPRLDAYGDALRDAARDRLFEGLAELPLSPNTVAIVHLPFWWPLAKLARERFGWPVVYDCMDLHGGFATVGRAMVAQEDQLLQGADLVVVTSAVLEQRALKVRGNDGTNRTYRTDETSQSPVVIPNACDYAHFAHTPRANNPRPAIGYYGAISDWFDSVLVVELAQRRPDWDFVLVGGTYGGDVSRLARLPNVTLPGEQTYESLPEWLGRFDVAIIPFKRTPLTEATNPVKVYEMLASGKPVVSVPIPEVAALAPLVRLASTAADFERAIESSLAEPGTAATERQVFARAETWERRFTVLAAAVAALVPGQP
ncbi:MAG TPA: glycosyltransferase [Thermoanaerobaculia bacterium]